MLTSMAKTFTTTAIRPLLFNRRLLRIQYASSLYVDCDEKVIPAHYLKPVAPVLVLAGNIGANGAKQTDDFLRHCSRNWDEVVVIPGDYELGNNQKLMSYGRYHNVIHLNNDTHYMKQHNTKFIGTPYKTMADRQFMVNSFSKTNPGTIVVAVTNKIPDAGMLHSADGGRGASGEVYPCVNAWICDYMRGAKTVVYDNGVLVAYNARGHIARQNDISGNNGWRRDAFLDIPNPPQTEGSYNELLGGFSMG